MPLGRRIWARLRAFGRRVRASASSFPFFGGSSAFRGADMNRLSADRWQAVNHPDTEIQYALRTLRAASRNLVRNVPYIAGVAEAFADNVVGNKGIRCKPVVTKPRNDPNGELDKPAIWEIERAWREWCEEYATADGVESWYETERLIVKSWFTDGEVFVRRHRGFDNPYAYAVELLDPDLLDEQFSRPASEGKNEIVMGVEVDRFGRPLFYHFWERHPDEIGRRERVPVPADEIAHFFVRYRPGQTRGFPLCASVLTTVEMIDGYTEAELVAARYHASKMIGVKVTNQDAVAAYVARLSLQNETGKGNVNRPAKMAPGQVHYFAPGEEPVAIDPTHPSDAFDPFLMTLLRSVSRGLHVSYFTLTGDTADANYSSQRLGLEPERDHFMGLQDVLAHRIYRPIYRDFLQMGLLSRALRLRGIATDFYAVEWQGRRWKYIDPEADVASAEREVKLGLVSRTELAAARGRDYEQVIDRSKADMEYAKTAGVYVGGVDTPPAARNANTRDNGGNGGDGGNGSNGNGGGRKPASRLAPFVQE